jgi:hypothetical protein
LDSIDEAGSKMKRVWMINICIDIIPTFTSSKFSNWSIINIIILPTPIFAQPLAIVVCQTDYFETVKSNTITVNKCCPAFGRLQLTIHSLLSLSFPYFPHQSNLFLLLLFQDFQSSTSQLSLID